MVFSNDKVGQNPFQNTRLLADCMLLWSEAEKERYLTSKNLSEQIIDEPIREAKIS
jgi:hypothetical protein